MADWIGPKPKCPKPTTPEKKAERAAWQRWWNATHRERSAEIAQKYRLTHLEQFRAANRRCEVKRRNSNPELNKARNKRYYERRGRLLKYGITEADYAAMLANQGGGCAICSLAPEHCVHGRLVVDHDHATNTVRGLLCDNCNHMLGEAADNSERLRAGAEYLIRSRIAVVPNGL